MRFTDLPVLIELLEPLIDATSWAITEHEQGYGNCDEWRIACAAAEALVAKLKAGEL